MEWTVVTVIVVIIGLISTVTKPLVQLNGNITKLTVAVDGFKEALDALKCDNRKDHDNFYSKLNSHDTALENHDCRIKELEGK